MPHLRRRAKKRARGKWQDNRLVDISAERFKEALQISGMGLADLARHLGETRQTLDYIARGVTKQCRQSRRTAIARALGVSEEELGGGVGGGMDWLVGELTRRPQADRAYNRLGRQCEAALIREGNPGSDLTAALLMLTQPTYWRGVLLTGLSNELCECEDLSPFDRDRVGTALANAFEAILQPWLHGKARLNYRAAHRLAP